MHGARGGHGCGKDNPAYKHGLRGGEWLNLRKEVNECARWHRKLAHTLI
jgi:hypothetical protein